MKYVERVRWMYSTTWVGTNQMLADGFSNTLPGPALCDLRDHHHVRSRHGNQAFGSGKQVCDHLLTRDGKCLSLPTPLHLHTKHIAQFFRITTIKLGSDQIDKRLPQALPEDDQIIDA